MQQCATSKSIQAILLTTTVPLSQTLYESNEQPGESQKGNNMEVDIQKGNASKACRCPKY